MFTVYLLLMYLACVGQGRRVQPIAKADATVATDRSLEELEIPESGTQAAALNPSRDLARLLLGLDPSAAFKFMSHWKIRPQNPLKRMRQNRLAKAKFADKKLVVITGTSSGLGRETAGELLRSGKYHVVGAVRDLDKMAEVAKIDDFPADLFTPMKVDLNSYDSVRGFVKELDKFKGGKPIDRLICNAATYQPSLPDPKWSEDGHEQQMQINFLSHFLMISLLLPDMARAPDPRIITVGAVIGNDLAGGNDLAEGGPRANLKKLEGLKAGAKNPISMLDGYNFDGQKAYKDSKLCLMMLTNMLHERYHRQTGIAFSSMYPGVMADSELYREKEPYFRKSFPLLVKALGDSYISQEDAGTRLFQVAHDPRCSQSGVSWLWKGKPDKASDAEASSKAIQDGGSGGDWDSIYENDQSDMVLDKELSADLWEHSATVTGAEWPAAYQPKSPCPTLKVIGAITAYSNKKEELKRMKPGEGVVGTVGGTTAKLTDAILGNTIGRVAKTAQRTLLGRLPEEAVSGSYQETKGLQKKKGLLRKLFSKRKKTEKKTSDHKKSEEALAVN
mmetsp:Transcript_88714/g.153522  ORF Transcript_88714/g.153522 Transcript_88714/m.153522 type:complete len:561 (+) Transcript_88714:58-1740(+)